MIYTNFKNTKLSKLGCGSLYFQTISENGPLDKEKIEQIIDYAYSQGINYFDTSCMYGKGECESVLGEILSKYPRESYYLVSKMPAYAFSNRDRIIKEFFNQLKRCRLEYFDFYMIQGISEKNEESFYKSDIVNVLIELKEEGFIKNLGFSFHGTPNLLNDIISLYNWDFVMLQLNYFDWEFSQGKELYSICYENNLPIFVMKPNKGGLLLKYGPDLSFAWLNQLEGIYMILSGMNEIEQIDQNIKYIQSNTFDQNRIDKAISSINGDVLIPCTNCQYCLPCPAGYNIPKWIADYNDLLLHGEVEKFIPPPNCMQCGSCEIKCPQKISITNLFQQKEKAMDEKYKNNVGKYFTEKDQSNFLEKRFAVLGCGGQGGNVALFLTRLGVKSIVLFDGDCFEESNINRQVGADLKHLGQNKAKVIKELCEEISTTVQVEAYPCYFGDNGKQDVEIVKTCDFIFDEMDYHLAPVNTRKYLRRCMESGIPISYGGNQEGGSTVGVLLDSDRFIYDKITQSLILGEQNYEKERIGQPAYLCAITAGLDVLNMVKYFTQENPKTGEIVTYDFYNNIIEKI